MKKILFILMLSSCCNIQAQLLNKYFQATDDSTKAMYYKQYLTHDIGYTEKIYYLNDSLYSQRSLSSIKPLIRNGKQTIYNKKGGIRAESNYIKDKIEGRCYSYYEDGKIEYEIDYSKGLRNGYLIGYYGNGNKRRIDTYKKEKFINGKCFGINGQDTVYFLYEKMASFQNGDLTKFRRYVTSKLKFPDEAASREITGKVFVKFNVNPKGKVVDVEVINPDNFYLSKAAVDVILNSPDWEPRIQEGKKVQQSFCIPINFKLKNDMPPFE